MFPGVSKIERTPGKGPRTLPDFSLDAKSVANALRITITGAGPIPFRSKTAGDGKLYYRPTSRLEIILAASTIGTANNVPFRFWVVVFDDDGVLRPGLINCLTTVAGAGAGRDVTALFAMRQFGVASSTLLGGASNSAGTFYTEQAAVTSKPFCVLGYVEFSAGLAAVGTYGIDPSRVHAQRDGDPLPGDIIQVQRTDTGAVASGTTQIPLDDTIPQITEGDQYMSQAITPSSAANVLDVSAQAYLNDSGATTLLLTLHQDAVANALAVMGQYADGTNSRRAVSLSKLVLSGTASATTLKIRAGPTSAVTVTFNGTGGTREFAGVLNSFLQVTEITG